LYFAETAAWLKLRRRLSHATPRARTGREAHSLKSAAATFGYRSLASFAQQIEKSAEQLSRERYLELLDDVDRAYAAGRALDRQYEEQTSTIAAE